MRRMVQTEKLLLLMVLNSWFRRSIMKLLNHQLQHASIRMEFFDMRQQKASQCRLRFLLISMMTLFGQWSSVYGMERYLM